MTEQSATVEQDAPSVVHVDPNDLIFATNVRLDARLDAEFEASIAERGVIQAVVATRRGDGALVIRAGHRRTLAAVNAGHATIPVYVIPESAEADRLIDQMAENDHRTGLSTGERIAAFAQLDALGLSAADIAKQTATKAADVKAALTISASKAATQAANQYASLTLDQSAVLADFEDEPETIERLIEALRRGMFEHVAQRARDEREQRQACEAVENALREAGVNVIEAPRYDDLATRVESLFDSDGKRLRIEEHATCPGHAAFVRWDGYWTHDEPEPEPDDTADLSDEKHHDDSADEAEGYDDDHYDEDEDDEDPPSHRTSARFVRAPVTDYACTDPATHGHRTAAALHGTERVPAANLTEPERAAKTAERRDVIASNKAWDSAEKVRRAWLATFAKRKTPPKAAAHFIAATLASDPHLMGRTAPHGLALACDLLGAKTTATVYTRPVLVTDKTTTPRAQVIALVLIIAAYEQGTGRHCWRNVDSGTAAYLRFIEAQGYALADVERRACGENPLSEAAEEPAHDEGAQDVEPAEPEARDRETDAEPKDDHDAEEALQAA